MPGLDKVRNSSENVARILFFGTPEFSCPALKALIDSEKSLVACVVTQSDKPAGRGKRVTSSAVANLAQSHSIPVVKPTSIKKDPQGFLESIADYGPFDIAIVVAFGQILPQEVLSFPVTGSLNIHASLLPRWRGAAPMQRAIMAGDAKSGVCLMKMDQGLDTGPVYRCSSITLSENQTLGTLHDSLATLGANLLSESLADILSGKLVPVPQSEEGVSYARKITKEETVIDWTQSAKDIDRLIRALSPFPGAFSRINQKRLKIFSARPTKAMHSSKDVSSGQVALLEKNMLEIMCGDGNLLALKEVQFEGKKRMQIEEFIKGAAIAQGDRFELP
jgi:methionyl-tRNA formyltransferase